MIGDHGDEFDERNLLLQLALGLVSACRRLDLVLERHGRRVSPAEEAPGDAPLVDFVLGLIAFRDRAMGALASARRRAPRPGAPPAGALRASRDLDGLLR